MEETLLLPDILGLEGCRQLRRRNFLPFPQTWGKVRLQEPPPAHARQTKGKIWVKAIQKKVLVLTRKSLLPWVLSNGQNYRPHISNLSSCLVCSLRQQEPTGNSFKENVIGPKSLQNWPQMRLCTLPVMQFVSLFVFPRLSQCDKVYFSETDPVK
jgi:hypothetical protein